MICASMRAVGTGFSYFDSVTCAAGRLVS